MVKMCSSCGTRTADNQSLFCNKCGCPFPQPQPKRSLVPQQRENQAAAVPGNPSGGMARQAQTSQRRPAPKKTGGNGSLPFKKLITGDYLRLIYILGAIVIILVSLLGISAGFSKPGTEVANESFVNTTALAVNPTASPLFWMEDLL
jgi:uncharacterized membrane protein YvbJ